MQTIEHVMCLLLACGGDMKFFDEHLAAFLLPDAIRMYSKAREYSHFEKSPDGRDSSHMRFPADMKHLSAETVQQSLAEDSHLVEHPKCVVGEETDISMFLPYNNHLPDNMKTGILLHLVQDIEFDGWIRSIIDCKDRYEDKFVFAGRVYDGAECRHIISEIETHLAYALAKKVYETLGIVCNQDWFDEHVYPVLMRDYPEELANNTYKYMLIPQLIDKFITDQDWKLVESDHYNVPYKEYQSIVEREIAMTSYVYEMRPC